MTVTVCVLNNRNIYLISRFFGVGFLNGQEQNCLNKMWVVISEVEKENWGFGGMPVNEGFPDKK